MGLPRCGVSNLSYLALWIDSIAVHDARQMGSSETEMAESSDEQEETLALDLGLLRLRGGNTPCGTISVENVLVGGTRYVFAFRCFGMGWVYSRGYSKRASHYPPASWYRSCIRPRGRTQGRR